MTWLHLHRKKSKKLKIKKKDSIFKFKNFKYKKGYVIHISYIMVIFVEYYNISITQPYFSVSSES